MLQHVLKWFIVISNTLSLGFLSFVGAILLNLTWFGVPSLVWGFLAFGLAVAIEGLVYYKNISNAWEKWWNAGESYLRTILTTAVLKKKIEEDQNSDLDAQEYKNNKKILEKIHHQEDELEPIDWVLEPRQRWKLRQYKNSLEERTKKLEAQLALHYRIDSASIDKLLETHASDNEIFEDNSNINQIIANDIKQRSSRRWVMFIKILSMLTGGSTLFASLAAAQAGFIPLGIMAGTATSWAICWPIAIFSGIGWMLVTYNNLIQRLHERTFCQLETPAHKGPGYLLSRLLLSLLAGFIAAAVFWTWLSSGIEIGNQILPFGRLGITLFIGSLAVATAISTFIWNITNILNTVNIIEHKGWKKLKTFFDKTWRAIKEAWREDTQKGNYHHFFNPFRWLEKLINILFPGGVLVAHSVSNGLTANHLGKVPPFVTTIVNGVGDGLIDGHYLSHDHGHDHDEPCVQEHGKKQAHGHGHFSPSQCDIAHHHEKHGHGHGHGHGHKHSHGHHNHSYQQLDDKPAPFQPPSSCYVEKLPETAHEHFDLAGVLLVFILIPFKIVRFALDLLLIPVMEAFFLLEESWAESARHSYEKIFCKKIKCDIEDFRFTPGPISLPEQRRHSQDSMEMDASLKQFSRLVTSPAAIDRQPLLVRN